jgi:hypothetical protein
MEQLEVGVQVAQDSIFVFLSKTGTKEKRDHVWDDRRVRQR